MKHKTKDQLIKEIEDLKDKLSAQAIESEARMKHLAEATIDAIFFAKDGIGIDANQIAADMFGYNNPSDFIGKFGTDIIAPESHEIVLSHMLSSKTEPYEAIGLRKDGTKFPIAIRAKSMPYKDIGIVRVTSIMDLSEQKTAEAKLDEKTMILDNVINRTVDVAIATTDLDMRITSYNPMAEKYFGYTANEVLGKTVQEIHMQERVDADLLNRALKIVDETGEYNYILTQNLQHGKRILSSRVASMFDSDSKPIGYALFSWDITELYGAKEELQKNESRLRALFNAMTDVVFEMDYNGTYLSIAPTAPNLMVKPSEDTLGKTLHDLFPKQEADIFLGFIRNCINENKTTTIEYPLLLNNQLKWFEGTATPKTENSVLYIARDITDKRKTEKDNIKLSTAVEQSPSVIAITNLKGVLEYVNPKFTELTGYSRDEVIGKNTSILKSDDQPEQFYNNLWHTIKSGKVWHGVFHNKKKNGELFWELASISAILDTKGKIINYLKVAEDITERKKAEDELKESEEKYRKLIETTSEGFWIINTEGKTIGVNQSLCEMLGYSEEEILNSTPYAFVDDENRKIFVNQLSKANTNKQRIYEIDMVKKDNTTISTLFNATTINDKNGKYAGSFAFITNISERKRAERIQYVLYNISNAVTTTNTLGELISQIQVELGTIIDTTNFYVALYKPETDMLSLPYYADEHDEFTNTTAKKTLTKYVIETKKPLLANLKLKKELVEKGKLIHQGSLSKVWLGVPLEVEGEIIGVYAVQSYKDEDAYNESDMEIMEFVSDQISISIHKKKAEQELQKQNEEFAALNEEYKATNNYLRKTIERAEESDRLKTAFLQNISHEIRTPMNGIMGFTSLLKQQNISAKEQQSYVDVILTSGNRMLNTLSNLMDISKLETGQMNLVYSSTEINKKLENLFDFYKPEAEKKGLKLRYTTSLNNNDIINTDKEKVYDVLSNLINNAVKYCPTGSIDFGYKKKDQFLEFFVKDTGIGIPKNRQQAIFERFVQADIEDIKVWEGSGLGLSISKAYVEMLGGKIWVESKVGVGTQFYFTIPYNKKEHIENFGKIPHTRSEKQISKLKMLIVENEESADKLLSIILKDVNSECLHARNGAEAVIICRQNPDINVILMDIKMPVMNGYEATKQIREFNSDIIIIAQTAHALVGDREKAIAAGCDEYITKPINIETLIELINKLVSG